MNPADYHPWVHRTAILTAWLALLPIVVGALVTTQDAGMAFRDWPSSDGHSILMYPWLKSAGDKFLEHGHRLAGIVIGLASISLTVITWLKEPRCWVRWLSVAVLLCVIGQGILGGQRVLLDARGLAFVHGLFAACVFSLIAVVVLVTGRNWFQIDGVGSPSDLRRIRTLAAIAVGVTFVQYLLGGLLRHRGMVLHEHLGFAFVVLASVVVLLRAVYRSGATPLRRFADALAGMVLLQLMLGAGAWVTKYGFGDYVAVHGSLVQVVLRTSHVVVGMLLLMTSVVLTVQTLHLLHESFGNNGPAQTTAALPSGWSSPSSTFPGGIA